MSTDYVPTKIADWVPKDQLSDPAWLEANRDHLVRELAAESGWSPRAPRNSKRQAMVAATKTYRRLLRAARRQGNRGAG